MSHGRVSPLAEEIAAAGGVVTDGHGEGLVRHFGDPAGEYRAAVGGAAVFDRSHRTRLVVRGRDPGRMLGGILTGTIPLAPSVVAGGLLGGVATYHCVLTPKGKMITDLWCIRRGAEDTEGFLLDVPVPGRTALLEHLGKVLPPRFASVEDVSSALAMISVVGPGAAVRLGGLALGGGVEAAEMDQWQEGEWRADGPSAAAGLIVKRTEDVWPAAYDVLGPVEPIVELWRALVEKGATSAGRDAWTTLRVETARPTFGIDMDENTIPVEAGIQDRAIDYRKGCYTGQEVIVRIRDRGHVNRHLRQLMLGDVPPPAKGTDLFEEGAERPVGVVTSAVHSPRFGQTVALGYLKRGVTGQIRAGGV